MQNRRGWTAGSISGKLRALNVKTRASLELLLNCLGLRVDFKETQGLFNKSARANGYVWIWTVGSGSGGSDLIGSGSYQGRWFRSQRIGSVPARGRQRRSPELGLRDGASPGTHRSWPNSAFPGSIWPGFGSRVVYATRVMHLGTQLGLGRPATASAATAAGLLGGAHRSCAFSPLRVWL